MRMKRGTTWLTAFWWLAQDSSNFSALAMELLQSCTKPSIFMYLRPQHSLTQTFLFARYTLCVCLYIYILIYATAITDSNTGFIHVILLFRSKLKHRLYPSLAPTMRCPHNPSFPMSVLQLILTEVIIYPANILAHRTTFKYSNIHT